MSLKLSQNHHAFIRISSKIKIMNISVISSYFLNNITNNIQGIKRGILLYLDFGFTET